MDNLSRYILPLTFKDSVSMLRDMAKSFRTIIQKWPDVPSLAADLDEKPDTVRKWKERDTIPSHAWGALVRAAKQRGIALTSDEILSLARKPRAA